MKQFVAMPSCLSCECAEQYIPPRCRTTTKYRCKYDLHPVDGSTIPGKNRVCPASHNPGLPFGFVECPEIPDHLL